jgi:hypothetical protein
VIAADGVTLYLNGFNIAGPSLCTAGPAVTCLDVGKGIGIEAAHILAATRGVRVFNGLVRGMGSMGILLDGIGSSVSQITVDQNGGVGMSVLRGMSAKASPL